MSKRNIVITGASSGIGLAISKKLQAHNLILVGRRSICDDMPTDASQNARYLSYELSKRDNVKAMFSDANDFFNTCPDTVVVNAGLGLGGTLLTSNEDKWQELFDLNCLSAFQQMRIASSQMIEKCKHDDEFINSKKDIVVMNSVVGKVVSEANPVYGATKFALGAMAEALRKEVGRYNIRVTVIEPGFVRSNFQERAGYDLQKFNEMEEAFGPFLKPEDIAEQVAFILNLPVAVNISTLTIRPTRQIP